MCVDKLGERLYIGDRVKTDFGDGLIWGLHRRDGSETADVHLMNTETIEMPCGCLTKTEHSNDI